MLDSLLASEGYLAFVDYLSRPETGLAVFLPGALSLCILLAYLRAGRLSNRLQLLWLLLLPIGYLCARWEHTSQGEVQLYIYSAFSVACVILLFKRIYVPPALAYALTFLSLWCVDITHALCRALDFGGPLSDFYYGVGGAGWRDALFLLPLGTAAAVAYAAARIQARGERMAEL